MTKEEKIKNILDEASAQIMAVLRGDERTMAQASDNIDATANKIMNDSFNMKTLLVDENNIDAGRYEMLEFLPEEDIIELFESCKKWSTIEEDDGKYTRFCENMAKLRGTTLDYERTQNINSIIFKYKQINVNNTGSSNGEIEAEKV
jgi:hypothetical protein